MQQASAVVASASIDLALAMANEQLKYNLFADTPGFNEQRAQLAADAALLLSVVDAAADPPPSSSSSDDKKNKPKHSSSNKKKHSTGGHHDDDDDDIFASSMMTMMGFPPPSSFSMHPEHHHNQDNKNKQQPILFGSSPLKHKPQSKTSASSPSPNKNKKLSTVARLQQSLVVAQNKKAKAQAKAKTEEEAKADAKKQKADARAKKQAQDNTKIYVTDERTMLARVVLRINPLDHRSVDSREIVEKPYTPVAEGPVRMGLKTYRELSGQHAFPWQTKFGARVVLHDSSFKSKVGSGNSKANDWFGDSFLPATVATYFPEGGYFDKDGYETYKRILQIGNPNSAEAAATWRRC